MTQSQILSDGESHNVALNEMPPSALQALYHAVTGKTENMKRELFGNVIVHDQDVQNIVRQIIEQIQLHENSCDPTVTVVVKHDNEKSVTYSSWERYNTLRANHPEVTSEILIKIETVLKIPNTVTDQRIVINLDIDSALPLLISDKKKKYERIDLGFFLFHRNTWKTVTLNIDFIDFLVAKNFASIIEEWFSHLEKIS